MTKRKTTATSNVEKKIYLIAGEESGDQIGGALMEHLKRVSPDLSLRFDGIGGQSMASQGLKSLFPMTDLSIMGLLEIIPHTLNILARLNQTYEDIAKLRPDVVVTIDAPGFNFRLAKRLKPLNIKVIHITAPTVWAWRPRRAERVAGFLTHLLTLFSFEPPYFTKHGLKTTFMGHPLVEKHLWDIDPAPFVKKLKLKKNQPLLCLLPGSRLREIKTHLPIFLETVKSLKRLHPDLCVVIPTLPAFEETLQTYLSDAHVEGHITCDPLEKYQAMRASTAALAASGTVTLELGLCNTPMVVAYKANPLSAAIVKKLLLTQHVSLANILLKREVVPEFLQAHCRADLLATSLQGLLDPKNTANATQRETLLGLRTMVESSSGKAPSAVAADIILETLMGKTEGVR